LAAKGYIPKYVNSLPDVSACVHEDDAIGSSYETHCSEGAGAAEGKF
jgi:hypothetical protein